MKKTLFLTLLATAAIQAAEQKQEPLGIYSLGSVNQILSEPY